MQYTYTQSFNCLISICHCRYFGAISFLMSFNYSKEGIYMFVIHIYRKKRTNVVYNKIVCLSVCFFFFLKCIKRNQRKIICKRKVKLHFIQLFQLPLDVYAIRMHSMLMCVLKYMHHLMFLSVFMHLIASSRF